MSQILTGTNTTDPGLTPTAAAPSDGDAANAASVNGALQAIMNAIGWLRKNVGASAAHTVGSLTMNTNFAGYAAGSTWKNPQARKDSFGWVHLEGSIMPTVSGSSAAALIATLPVGFQPATDANAQGYVGFVVPDAARSGRFYRVFVGAAGGGDAGKIMAEQASDTGAWPLDGISFYAGP